MNAHVNPKTSALTSAAQSSQGQQPVLHLVAPEAGGQGGAVHIPSAALLTQGDYARIGHDLMITGRDGEQVLVQDYFLTDTPSALVAEDGAQISGDLAERLAGSMAPGQYAQAGNGGIAKQSIGQIETANGSVNVIHTDGSKGMLHKGDAVFQGDVLQTDKGSAVGVLFVDKTSLSLGGDGRMVLDQMVFDASSGAGKSAFSLVQGTFSFVSGQIAKASPDAMVVRTPVATIGIRGTLGSGGYTPQQGLTVAVLSEGANGTGEVTITNAAGSQTINTANSAIMVTSFFNAPPPAFSFTPLQFASSGFAQAMTALPSTPASPGAAQTVQQIQNLVPAPQAAPTVAPQGSTPGAGSPAPQSSGPAPANGEAGQGTGPAPAGQPSGASGAPQSSGGGAAFGLIDVGVAPPAPAIGAQPQATQMFSAAAQVAIDQAISQGASIEQAHSAALNVQAAFNTALSQGAAPQQALAAAGAAAVQTGLLSAQPAAANAAGAGAQAINPFAAMATGQASVSNIGTMVIGAGHGSGQGQSGAFNVQGAFAGQGNVATATSQGTTPGQTVAAQADPGGEGGGSLSPASIFGTGGVGTYSVTGAGYGNLSSQQQFNQGLFESGASSASAQIAAQIAAQTAASQTTATDTSSSNNTTNATTTTTTTTVADYTMLYGTTGDDTLTGSSGNDSIMGLAGADTLKVTAGYDRVDGGDGNDIYAAYSSISASTVTVVDDTGTGDVDTFFWAVDGIEIGQAIKKIYRSDYTGSADSDTDKDDLFFEFASGGQMVVMNHFDSVAAQMLERVTDGDGSYIYLSGNLGAVAGQKSMIVGDLSNTDIVGGTTADMLIWAGDATYGNRNLTGGGGDDEAVFWNADHITFDLTTLANDKIFYGSGASDYHGLAGVSSVRDVTGSWGDDMITGDGLNNGFTALGGSNVIAGGSGSDNVDYGFATAGVVVTLSGGAATVTHTSASGTGTDTLSSIENISGTDYADTLTGDTAGNVFQGGRGNDVIDLGADGGSANDTVTFKGGDGAYDAGSISRVSSLGTDTIANFNGANDYLQLSNQDFGLGTLGLDAATTNSLTYMESDHVMSGTAFDYNGDSSTGKGIIVVGAATGSAGVQIWFTTEQSAATTSNSYQIATVSGINTTQIDVTDFQTSS